MLLYHQRVSGTDHCTLFLVCVWQYKILVLYYKYIIFSCAVAACALVLTWHFSIFKWNFNAKLCNSWKHHWDVWLTDLGLTPAEHIFCCRGRKLLLTQVFVSSIIHLFCFVYTSFICKQRLGGWRWGSGNLIHVITYFKKHKGSSNYKFQFLYVGVIWSRTREPKCMRHQLTWT